MNDPPDRARGAEARRLIRRRDHAAERTRDPDVAEGHATVTGTGPRQDEQ